MSRIRLDVVFFDFWIVKSAFYCYFIDMLEELKIPIEELREEIMNVWGRL